MASGHETCGCFPTGRHYPGIEEGIARSVVRVMGLADEFDASAPWRSHPVAVIDFETTGLDTEKDRVLEMGIACFDDGQLVDRHNWLVDPGMPVPEESRKIHGISDEDLANAPRFEEIFPDVVGLLSGRLPVAYNASFDQRFLLAEFARIAAALDVDTPPALRSQVVWIDPLVWVRELQKYEKSKKLTDVCARMDITIEQAHRAADDAEAAGHVLAALAPDMPRTYGQLIRVQAQYAAQQEASFAKWRSRRG